MKHAGTAPPRFEPTEAFGLRMDETDALAGYRERFCQPRGHGAEQPIYFAGNPLGLMPCSAIAQQQGINAVGVDIGGATTDVFSVYGGNFSGTVSANLGMSYLISNVCAEEGLANVLRWIHFALDERELRNRVKNKMIRPTTTPGIFFAAKRKPGVSFRDGANPNPGV